MIESIRPNVKLLSDLLAKRIIDEAFELLATIGVFVENQTALMLLEEGGAIVDRTSRRVHIPRALVDLALSSAPHEIHLFDSPGERTFTVGGEQVHFDPGSAALRIFDHATQLEREAITIDVIRFARLTQKLDNYHFQSTGLISSDVPQSVADCYRLFVALQFCSKPVVTGTFVVEGFAPMAAMLTAIRGSKEELKKKPLAIFDACPSPPLKWSSLTAQSVIDCARAGVPSEFVAMPLTGATAPVTLAGALVQHTAENLSGLVISQLAHPGAPAIFGGSPASFDMRTGTPPMGAMETMMLDAAYTQIGKILGLPTHAYMGLSDSKSVDAQAGLESGIGAILAVLAGVNVVSGGGMMDFESCQSLEKLVIDNEICGMAYRLLNGISQREDPMALPLLSELLEGIDFFTHPHTMKWLRIEHSFPKLIDRGNHQQWVLAGKPTLTDRASEYVKTLLSKDDEPFLSPGVTEELRGIMNSHGRRFGLDHLPSFPAEYGWR